MNSVVLDRLFEPLEMPNLKLKNRFIMAPLGTGFNIERTAHFLTARAKGDVALITTGETCVHSTGRVGIKNELLLESDNDIAPLSSIASQVKKEGAKIVLQLNHAGRYSPGKKVGGQSVAPSAMISGYTGELSRELTTGEVDDLVTAFAKAAFRAREAGFDGVEFMGSSGYLISSFLSPLTNRRKDKYGGDTAGRANFMLSILQETRKLTGPDFNICVKFDADDGMNGGVTLEESRLFAQAFESAGADRLNIWSGWHESTRPMLVMSVPRGAFAYLSEEIKKVVSVPVSIAGRINDPIIAAEIIANEQADLIAIGRALLADPEFVKKTLEGRLNEIRRCTACCHCFDRIVSLIKGGSDEEVYCSVNPEAGREGENLIRKADKRKHVVVIGGGPAGLEVSRIASLRRHKVTLYEKGSAIGGMVNLAFVPPYKEELKNIVEYYSYQLKLLNINVKLSSTFDAEDIESEKPDTIVLATGAKTVIPNIPGIKNNTVFTIAEVLEDNTDTGMSVVVIGGGMAGLETAEYLADMGKKVTVIEMDKIAADVGQTTRWSFISRLRRKVTILSSTRVLEIRDKSVLILKRNNEEKEIEADSVVIAAGMESNRDLVNLIAIKGIEYYIIGSSKKPGRIDEAVSDAFNVGCII